MKRVFSMLVAIVAATMSFAQSSMLATLSHNGEITTYYGATALRDAYNASQHGDIITLSSGSFAAVNIEKALTIRGAGMQVDTITKTYPTIIAGNFDINIPDSVEQRLTMEGLYNNSTVTVYGTLMNASFLKDRFFRITYINPSITRMKNLTFIHCMISTQVQIPSESSASFISSYVANPYGNSSSSSVFEFSNCFVLNFNNVYNSTFTNCILYGSNSSFYLSSSNSAFYCLGKSSTNNMFDFMTNTTNTNFTGEFNALFKTYTGAYSDTETFELTDAAKAQYLGGDGKEVGMYGGSLPFDPVPTNPQITKCNVASKSTADGKLSVDIEVSVTE